MSEEVKPENKGAWKWWCCAPVAGIALLAALGGAVGYFSDGSKEEATYACERLAMLRGESSELVDFKTEHLRADSYKVTGTVVTPGLPDEEFVGYASRDNDGDYVCQMG